MLLKNQYIFLNLQKLTLNLKIRDLITVLKEEPIFFGKNL